jgi:hypothetical protein
MTVVFQKPSAVLLILTQKQTIFKLNAKFVEKKTWDKNVIGAG